LNNIVNLRTFATARGVPIVVLIDMQKEYLATPRMIAIPNIEPAVKNCRKILAHARKVGLPTIFVRWLDQSAPFFNKATPFVGWIDGFEPQRNEMIFDRSRPSCYASNDFASLMQQGGADVVIAGFAGEAACLTTMVEAFHRSHRMTFLADASASHPLGDMTAEAVHSAVAKIAGIYGEVEKTDVWLNAIYADEVIGG
jgi:nicotinamidase-related amidase